jgi:prepilin-type N-terminal cleavage/methylation domain-containing protein
MRNITGQATKRGFTLIELVVTLCIAGIFSTFAMEYYLQAVKANRVAAERDHSYFEYNVNKNRLKKTLAENEGFCEDGIYHFTGEASDSLTTAIPFAQLQCSPIAHGRTLVYYIGPINTTKTGRARNAHPIAFSSIVE